MKQPRNLKLNKPKTATFAQLINKPFDPRQWYVALELDVIEVRSMTMTSKTGFTLLGWLVWPMTGKRIKMFKWNVPADEVNDYVWDWTFASIPSKA